MWFIDKREMAEEQKKSSTNVKDIFIGIGIAILLAILIGSFKLLMDNMESRLKNSLSESFKEEFMPIKSDIKEERLKRIELAAFLMKNKELDIPTNLLTVYENIDKEESFRAQFKQELTKQLPLLTSKKIESMHNDWSKNEGYVTFIAPFSEKKYMIARSNYWTDSLNIQQRKQDIRLALQVMLQDRQPVKLAMTDDWVNILNSKTVKTGNVWLIDNKDIYQIIIYYKKSSRTWFYTRNTNLIPSEFVIQDLNLSEFETVTGFVKFNLTDSTNLDKEIVLTTMKSEDNNPAYNIILEPIK